ncbi:MAG: hypothetical protein CSA45_04285 [Gammaproteobacteria bacterium]|nr:MAG: hypothetical protein CSA45_04285 [Gammaproteobacteria bacterium]
MKKQTIFSTVLIGGLLTLAGCVTGQGGGSGSGIKEMTMSLPQQVQWVVSQNKTGKDGNQVTEWVPKGFKTNNTPVRIIYQKMVPANKPQDIVAQMAGSLKKNCNDIKVSEFKSASKYPNQVNAEVLCGKLGKSPVGIAMYSSVFTDANANHLVIGEVKIPASKKAGVLDPKTKKEKEQARNAAGLVQLVQGFMQTVRACESKGKCM